MLLICIPASATQNIIFTDWNADHAYVGTFNITGSTPSDNWKFVIPSTEAGIIYKLYSISDASVKDTNTSTSSVVLEASNLSDGQYYMLQMIPSIFVSKYDPSNLSCNSELLVSNSTPVTQITYIQNNITTGRTYKLYDPSTLSIYGTGIATSTNATINCTVLPDGLYRVAEVGAEEVLFTYWNQSNATCNGILSISNTTPVSNVNISITSNGQGNRYVFYTMPGYNSVAQATINGTTNSLNLTNISDGEYRIARVGTERLLFSYWNPANLSCNAIFTISNSTPFSRLRLVLSNISGGTKYSVVDPTTNDTAGYAYAYADATITIYGIQDGLYWIVETVGNTQIIDPSFVGIVFVGGAFVLAAGVFVQKRRGRP